MIFIAEAFGAIFPHVFILCCYYIVVTMVVRAFKGGSL